MFPVRDNLLHKQLCFGVEGTAIGEVLSKVKEEDCEDFYKRYLSDFVKLVHKCSKKNRDCEIQEYKVTFVNHCNTDLVMHASIFYW